MHWALWCLIGLAAWCGVSVLLAAAWALFCRRRDRILMDEGRLIPTSYFPSEAEEAAILRARQALSS